MILIGKDPDPGKDGRQKEKRVTEDERLGWHHGFSGHELNSRREWGTERPGMLQSMGSQSLT